MPVVNVYPTSVNRDIISRYNLLVWVNNRLKMCTQWEMQLSKIEEMASGAAYCLLTDFLFPMKVPLQKLKWNSQLDVDWLTNWRVLQQAWKDIGIDKAIPVQNLIRGKFQDNFHFLKWFKQFYDANYDASQNEEKQNKDGVSAPVAGPSVADSSSLDDLKIAILEQIVHTEETMKMQFGILKEEVSAKIDQFATSGRVACAHQRPHSVSARPANVDNLERKKLARIDQLCVETEHSGGKGGTAVLVEKVRAILRERNKTEVNLPRLQNPDDQTLRSLKALKLQSGKENASAGMDIIASNFDRLRDLGYDEEMIREALAATNDNLKDALAILLANGGD